LGLALGGGGVRGLANLGVLEALRSAGIQPAVIAGTSMGAIVASIYAETLDPRRTEQRIRDYFQGEDFLAQAQRFNKASYEDERSLVERIFDKARRGYFYYRFLMERSVITPEAFFMGLDDLLPDKRLEDLRIPVACTVVNLESGRQENLSAGSLRAAVKASCAVPGVLPPVEIDGQMYVDGGWAEVVPVSAARELGANLVIGVNVSNPTCQISFARDLNSAVDIMTRADDIARALLNEARTAQADYIIRPEVPCVEWWDFDKADACVDAGFVAGELAVEAIKRLRRSRKWWSLAWR
jgi:NTE family protein